LIFKGPRSGGTKPAWRLARRAGNCAPGSFENLFFRLDFGPRRRRFWEAFMKDHMEIGKVVNTHGLKGHIKVTPWMDFVDDILLFDHIYIGKNLKRYDVEDAKIHKNSVLLLLKSVDSIEDAEKLKNEIVYMKKDLMPELEEDTFYLADLIGLSAILPDSSRLGVVKDVFKTGASEVLSIVSDDNKEYLVPFIKSCVGDVDIEGGLINITPIEGLFEP
jgi:16S rRNA processing protein RimM